MSVEDDGTLHYRTLGLSRAASAEDVKQAYRRLARTHHPDKGGDGATFAALQAAFETLSDPKTRATYDSLAGLRFRPGVAAPYSNSNPQGAGSPPQPHPPGFTEAMLLQQLLQRGGAHPGAVFDPMHQLCVTCEVCRRPATQQCWTCQMDICEFCTRRQHWKGSVSLHWPLVNQPGSMLEQLGRRELELKRREDGQAYKEAQQDYRPQTELLVLRQFQDAIVDIVQHQQQQQQQSRHLPNKQQQHSGADRPADSILDTSRSSSSTNTTRTAAATAAVASSITATQAAGCAPHDLRTGPADSLMPQQHQSARTPDTTSMLRSQAQPPQQVSAFAMPPSGTLLGEAAGGTLVTTTTTTTISSSSNSSNGALVRSATGRARLAVHNKHHTTIKPVNRCWAAWQKAPEEVRQSLLAQYDNRLARFYTWAQTDCLVLLALHLPTGGGKVPPSLTVESTPSTVLVQHKGFAPVLNRAWASPIDAAAGISSWASADGQLLVLRVVKGQPGRRWSCCFKGDPHMARHLQSPYRLVQLPAEVQLELQVPFWVQPTEDVKVDIGQRGLAVEVDGVMRLHRTFSWDEAQAAKQGSSYKVVDSSRSSWCVLDQANGNSTATLPGTVSSCGNGSVISSLNQTMANTAAGAVPAGAASLSPPVTRPVRRVAKLLSITLALPNPTEEELMYKRGVRQNNASAVRSCPHGAGKPGVAFFLEDEDEWGLQSVLQAMMFQEAGRAWLSPKPWELAAGAGSLIGSGRSGSSSSSSATATATKQGSDPSSGFWVEDEQLLPPEVASHLKWLRTAAAGGVDGATPAALPSRAIEE